jgi:hypothetical protein
VVRRDGAAIRQERMAEIAREIHSKLNQNTELSLSKTIAMFQYRFGLTRDKILEYLGILQDLGQFEVDSEKDRIQKVTEAQES